MSGLWKFIYEHLKKTITAFNGWRKRYWLTRVVILLLIFSFPIYERLSGNFLIVGLVKIAIQTIFNSSEPELAAAKTNYYRICEAQRLRTSIKTYLNKNKTEIVFDERELNKKSLPSNASFEDLRKLADIAKQLKLLPLGYNPKQVIKKAFYAGLAETEYENRPFKKEIDDCLAQCSTWPDYTKWTTWEIGIKNFFDDIFFFLFVCGPLPTTIAWLAICFYTSALFNQILPLRSRKIIAVIIPLSITLLLMICNTLLLPHKYESEVYTMIAFSALVIAVSLKGTENHLDSIRSFLKSISAIIFIWGLIIAFVKTLSYSDGISFFPLFYQRAGNLILNENIQVWQYLFVSLLVATVFILCFLLSKSKSDERKN